MQKFYFIIMIFVSMLSSLIAQQNYTCTIQNQTVVGTEVSFDIYMQRTGPNEIYLGQSEFSLNFNGGNFTNPSVSFVKGTDLALYSVGVAIPTGYSIVKFSVGSLTFDNQSEFDVRICKPATIAPGTKLATITLTGISNTSGTAGLQWRTVSPHDSKVFTYANVAPWNLTNITVRGTYTNPPDQPLPVELSSFTASTNQNVVNLKWQTATEINNYGFEVERQAYTSTTPSVTGWEKIGFVNGNGNSNSPRSYFFSDNNPSGGSKFLYRLKQIDNDGQFEYSDAVEVMVVPMEYTLYQNYPNPFNPSTKIKFALPEAGKVVLKIYDMTGAEVAELVNTDYEAGYYDIDLNLSNLSSGVYLYRLQSNNFTSVKKLMLIK